MSKLVWDKIGEHLYETGVSQGVLYPMGSDNNYEAGVVWNGLISITEKPTGAEATPLYADNIKYLNLLSAEDLEATIEAYTYPKEFALCDGSAELVPGVVIQQQSRKTFGVCYKSAIGNDTDNDSHGYKLHLIYGAVAAPSEKAYNTINDNPDAITFSWDVKTTPVPVTGDFKPTASLIIDSTTISKQALTAIETILYGTDAGDGEQGTDPRLPLPDEIAEIVRSAA